MSVMYDESEIITVNTKRSKCHSFLVFWKVDWIQTMPTCIQIVRYSLLVVQILSVISSFASNLQPGIKHLRIIDVIMFHTRPLALPLHTLLACKCGFDKIYIMHLFMYQWVYLAPEMDHWGTSLFVLATIENLACFITFVFWALPTRILYIEQFREACDRSKKSYDEALQEFFHIGLPSVLSGLWYFLFD